MKRLKVEITQRVEVEIEFPYFSKYIDSKFQVYTKIDNDKIYSIQKHLGTVGVQYIFQVEPFESPSTYFDSKNKSSIDEWNGILKEFESYFSYLENKSF